MTKEPTNLDISQFQSVEKPKKNKTFKTYNLILDVELELSALLGTTELPLQQVLDLTKGSIIKLDDKTTEPIKVLANGTEVAKGEVVIIEDNFGIRITEVSKDKL